MRACRTRTEEEISCDLRSPREARVPRDDEMGSSEQFGFRHSIVLIHNSIITSPPLPRLVPICDTHALTHSLGHKCACIRMHLRTYKSYVYIRVSAQKCQKRPIIVQKRPAYRQVIRMHTRI
jgi:hypothetical protein